MPTDFPSNNTKQAAYRVDPIYLKMTNPRINSDGSSLPGVQQLFGQLSTTSHFKITLGFTPKNDPASADADLDSWLTSCGVIDGSTTYGSLKYEFMCHTTTLPGSTMRVIDEFGSRQGVTERFPIVRDFSELTMDFYVDAKDYGIVRLFEEWLNFINPLYTSNGRASIGARSGSNSAPQNFDKNNFFRLRYPETYRRDVMVTKFERDLKSANGATPSMITYKFINAYPTNLTALPVSYDVSTITKTSVTFNYERYVILNHAGTDPVEQTYVNQPPINANGQEIRLSGFTVSPGDSVT